MTTVACRSRAIIAPLLVGAIALVGCSSPETDESASAAGQACLSGSANYTHYDAESDETPTLPASATPWSLSGASTEGGDIEVLATGVTDDEGAFEACVDGGPVRDATVTFSAENAHRWAVIDTTDAHDVQAFTSETVDTVEGDVDLGAIDAPEDTAGAFKAAASVAKLYAARGIDTPCWTARQETLEDCSPVTVVWDADTPDDEGGWWDPETDQIVLAGNDPSSQHLVVHELGHWWQGQLYDGWFPEVTDCDPHYVDEPSSTTCAWTEGFADAVAGHILGDRKYAASDGAVTAFEPEDGTSWPGGDETQGNIGAALLDLWALDGWEASVALFEADASSDFREYFLADRPDAGLSIAEDAQEIIQRHGIEYGE